MRGIELSGLDPCLPEPPQRLGDMCFLAGYSAKSWRIDSRDLGETLDQRFGVRARGMHRSHSTGRHRLHCPAPPSDKGERVSQRKDACEMSRDIFTDAVADHGRGLYPPTHPKLGERVLA